MEPGAYDVSSLSTPLNALVMAGGVTSRGSLRTVKHYRGKELIQEVDAYDLLLHGVRSGSTTNAERRHVTRSAHRAAGNGGRHGSAPRRVRTEKRDIAGSGSPNWLVESFRPRPFVTSRSSASRPMRSEPCFPSI